MYSTAAPAAPESKVAAAVVILMAKKFYRKTSLSTAPHTPVDYQLDFLSPSIRVQEVHRINMGKGRAEHTVDTVAVPLLAQTEEMAASRTEMK